MLTFMFNVSQMVSSFFDLCDAFGESQLFICRYHWRWTVVSIFWHAAVEKNDDICAIKFTYIYHLFVCVWLLMALDRVSRFASKEWKTGSHYTRCVLCFKWEHRPFDLGRYSYIYVYVCFLLLLIEYIANAKNERKGALGGTSHDSRRCTP